MKRIIAFLLVFLTCSISYSQNKIELNLVKGQVYPQTMSMVMAIKQKVKESEMTINMTISGSTAFSVTDYKEGVYDINVTYKALAIKTEIPGGESLSFDSEKDGQPDLVSKSLALMKDKPFQLKMNKQGEILQVSGIDKIYASMFEKFPNLSAEEKQKLQAQLEQSFGEKTFRNNMQNFMAFYPKTPIAKGGTWSSKNAVNSVNTVMEVENTYKLEDITASQYLVSGTSKMSSPNSENYTEANGASTKTAMSGLVTAHMKIDRKTGWIVEANTDMDLKGSISIKGKDKFPEGVTIPMEISGKATITAN